MFGFWQFLHLIGVVVWVGGMFFVLYCLRPAVLDLQPQQRAPLMISTMGRFFNYVLAAVILIWASGLLMVIPLGMKAAPPGWHIMIACGALMTILFLVIRFVLFPKAVAHGARADMPAAAIVLDRIRLFVHINLALGVLAIAAVSLLV